MYDNFNQNNLGINRFKIYDLLYTKPLYDYISVNELGKQEINVLIIGDSWVGNEALKAVFWCGQYPDTTLNITIASDNSIEYEQALYNALPAMKDLAIINGKGYAEKPYANIKICNISFEQIRSSGISDNTVEYEGLNLKKQTYLIVDVGDFDTNCLIANSIAETTDFISNKVLINVYDENLSCLPSNDYSIELNPFGGAMINDIEIKRIAKNINFLYNAKDNSMACKEEIDAEFESEFNNNFGEKIDKIKGDLYETLGFFIGGNYNVDSSLASAVHTKYKLNFCMQESNSNDGYTALVRAIDQKDVLYNELLKLEHRRWNAFMAIRGYRLPQKDELGYLYKNGSTHKNNTDLLHICMCECSDEGLLLDSSSELWKKEPKDIPQDLPDLDKASLYCHHVLKNRSKEIYSDNKFKNYICTLNKIHTNKNEIKTSLREFENAIEKLKNNDENAYVFYEYAYTKAKKLLENNSEYKARIEWIDKKLKLVKEWNKKTDFFSIDAELLDKLPISLWLDNKKKIISLTNMQATGDVIVPWILCVPEAIFFIPESSNSDSIEQYKENISNFFKDHGSNTKIIFKSVENNILEIQKEISEYILENNNVVLNISPCASTEMVMAASNYIDKLPIISYNYATGFKSFNEMLYFPRKPQNNYWTVNEYFGLINGEILNKYASTIPSDDCKIMEDFFWKNSSLWNDCVYSEFLQISKKERDENKIKKEENKNIFSRSLEKNSSIKKELLKILDTEGIIKIRNYNQNIEEVKFKVINDKYYDFLSDKGGNYFELLTYYKFLHSGFFNDVQTGVNFFWGTSSRVSNEIDVVAMNILTPVFISCKTGKVLKKEHIYEIAFEANRFGGIALLAISHDINEKEIKNDEVAQKMLNRAKESGVAIIDAHILKNDQLFKKAITQILKGDYKGPEYV